MAGVWGERMAEEALHETIRRLNVTLEMMQVDMRSVRLELGKTDDRFQDLRGDIRELRDEMREKFDVLLRRGGQAQGGGASGSGSGGGAAASAGASAAGSRSAGYQG